MTSAAAEEFAVRPLSPGTWADFAALVTGHGGVWGGCWCLAFHAEGRDHKTPESRCAAKKSLVDAGQAHAALVYDSANCVGWAQFGPPAELPGIKNRKAYETTLECLPDWRITCLFSAKTHRGLGVAARAAAGALKQIGRLGGGIVEAYPEDTAGRKVSASFLWNGTLEMFERLGFRRDRKIGKYKWVVRRTVQALEA